MTTTTIMLTKELQRKLKILCALKDTTYESLIKEMLELWGAVSPFRNKEEFSRWITKGDNIKIFGFKRVINKTPKNKPYDLLIEDLNGNPQRVKIEIDAKNFMAHKSDKIDYILSVFSTKSNVRGVPVLAINGLPSISKRLTSITLPFELKERLNGLKSRAEEPYQKTLKMLIDVYDKSGGHQ